MDTRTLFYYRIQHGRRVRWKLVLDQQNTLIDEGPADDTRSQLPVAQLKESDPRGTAYLSEMTRRGNVLSVDDGTVHIHRAPELELHVARFFTESTPCFFPGCQELRQRWLEFLAPNMDPDGTCPDCVMGALMNQFRQAQGLERILREWLASMPA
jgi:hypothetical protein